MPKGKSKISKKGGKGKAPKVAKAGKKGKAKGGKGKKGKAGKKAKKSIAKAPVAVAESVAPETVVESTVEETPVAQETAPQQTEDFGAEMTQVMAQGMKPVFQQVIDRTVEKAQDAVAKAFQPKLVETARAAETSQPAFMVPAGSKVVIAPMAEEHVQGLPVAQPMGEMMTPADYLETAQAQYQPYQQQYQEMPQQQMVEDWSNAVTLRMPAQPTAQAYETTMTMPQNGLTVRFPATQPVTVNHNAQKTTIRMPAAYEPSITVNTNQLNSAIANTQAQHARNMYAQSQNNTLAVNLHVVPALSSFVPRSRRTMNSINRARVPSKLDFTQSKLFGRSMPRAQRAINLNIRSGARQPVRMNIDLPRLF